MTQHTRVFHSDFEDRWYFWDDAWEQAVGPFDDTVEAHMELSRYLQRNHGSKETNPTKEGSGC